MTQQKFLIIGAGVAGISVAKQLIDHGHKITIIDNGKNRCSTVAAGVINPMVFRRMTKSWRADEFIPYAEFFYRSFGKSCQTTFYKPIVVRRLFSSLQERSFWLEKEKTDSFKDFLTPVTLEDDQFSMTFNEFGSGQVKGCSYIMTDTFLKASKKWISINNKVITEELNYADIDPLNATYKNERFDGVVFCEGVEVRFNPWFKEIPVSPTQGELLTISTDKLPENELLNRKCFVLPMGDHQYKVGSTYSWNTYSSTITKEGRLEIENNLAYLTDEPYRVIDQIAGIRPTTMDRRPIMGRHSEFSNLYVFNGLGAKGYLLAPLLAKEMVEFITQNKQLDKEVSIARYSK